jgi:hypothetical protein
MCYQSPRSSECHRLSLVYIGIRCYDERFAEHGVLVRFTIWRTLIWLPPGNRQMSQNR